MEDCRLDAVIWLIDPQRIETEISHLVHLSRDIVVIPVIAKASTPYPSPPPPNPHPHPQHSRPQKEPFSVSTLLTWAFLCV